MTNTHKFKEDRKIGLKEKGLDADGLPSIGS